MLNWRLHEVNAVFSVLTIAQSAHHLHDLAHFKHKQKNPNENIKFILINKIHKIELVGLADMHNGLHTYNFAFECRSRRCH